MRSMRKAFAALFSGMDPVLVSSRASSYQTPCPVMLCNARRGRIAVKGGGGGGESGKRRDRTHGTQPFFCKKGYIHIAVQGCRDTRFRLG